MKGTNDSITQKVTYNISTFIVISQEKTTIFIQINLLTLNLSASTLKSCPSINTKVGSFAIK